MYLYHFTIILSEKLFPPPASVKRSLLLFLFNLVEVTLTFAIFYQLCLGLSSTDAIIQSTLVFSTLGYPPEAKGMAAIQSVLDFLLVAIFLSNIVARK
jgi:hypothetical protein